MRDFSYSKHLGAWLILFGILIGKNVDAIPILQVNPTQVLFDQNSLNSKQIKRHPNIARIFIKAMLLHNAGNADVTITNMTSTLPDVFYPIDPGTNLLPTFPLVIQPGATYSFDLYYEDRFNQEPSPAATLMIISNVSQKNIPITANPTVGKLQFTNLDPDPSSDFMATFLGEVRWRVFELKNIGAHALQILKISIEHGNGIVNGFSDRLPRSLPFFLAVGESILLPVSFHPTLAGGYFDTISVTTNRLGDESVLDLLGCGSSEPLFIRANTDCPANTQSLYFRDYGAQTGDVDWHIQAMELRNLDGHSGVDFIHIDDTQVRITGPDAQDFVLLSLERRGTIFFDQTWPIVFQFAPKESKTEYHATAEFTFYLSHSIGAGVEFSPITQTVDLIAFAPTVINRLSPLSMSVTPPTAEQDVKHVGGCALSVEKTYDASLLGLVVLVSLFGVVHYFTKTTRKLR